MRKIIKLFERAFNRYNAKGLFRNVSDKIAVKILFHLYFDKALNLDSPTTFNEKIQWLKLNDRNPIYSVMVDKAEAKKYVKKKIANINIIKTLGVWNSFEEIDFSDLPNQFVLKCTHDSGHTIVCKDKQKIDIMRIKKILNNELNSNFYLVGREWPYKDVKPRIIAEEYMKNDNNELIDYKIHCFNGEPKFILVCKDRFSKKGMSEDFFDISWQHIPVKRCNCRLSNEPIERPENLEMLLEYARLLSHGIPFLRTDFYIINGLIYFGELTFFPASGFAGFEPPSYDKTFGDFLDLSEVKNR